MLQQFVFVDKLVSYEYFMDELKDYELQLLLQGHTEADRTSWDQTRMVMYSILAPYQKKGRNLKATDVMSFPWDKTKQEKYDMPNDISDTQIEAMRGRISQISKKISKNDG